ncbi:acetylcholine receptor subunit beta-type unc-29 [Amyelois transitella]|uniref:acetylcholine receptor subunit beta-type unc-29 n=1 Tax=Amyelois transitella TaxID=680683 RepID=UPI00298F6DDD|nr:acetylcholine receptor subunit beta-type unc-29 [Amyelois transitella]
MNAFGLIFMGILQIVKNEESPFSRQSLEEAWEEQLIKDLKSKYTTIEPPNSITEISAHFFLKYFTMGEDETTFTAYSWLVLSWNDERLKWNVTNYQGLSEIVYSSYKFWEPSIRLLNEVDLEDYGLHYGLCRLDKEGDITCVPRILHEAPCHTKLTNWPYDTQNCTLQIGFFTSFGNIVLKKQNKVVSLMGAEYGAEWTILRVYVEHDTVKSPLRQVDKGSQLDLTFLVEREGNGLGAIIVFPTILMTIITLSTFMLSVTENIRLGIICFNLSCHFWFITELSNLIPKHSENSPTILFYLRDSVMINILLVLFSMFLIRLRKKTVPTPSWISSINENVLKSKFSFLIWPRWEAQIKKGISEEKLVFLGQWADFSSIVNCFCLYIVTFVYVYYICVYVPRPSVYNEEQLASSGWVWT